jgi:predicted nucleotidyltransferase
LQELLRRLSGAEVRFVLVGGLAVNAWGYLRVTRDVDVVPDPDPENLSKLGDLLPELAGLGQVNVLQGLPQIPPFEVLDAAGAEVDMDGLVVRVCSLEHLLAMKRASDRLRDRDDLEALEAAQGAPEGED